METGSNDVEIARHDLRIERLAADVERLGADIRRLETQRVEDLKTIRKFETMATAARIVMLVAITIGGFGAWLVGIIDNVRKLFSHP